MACKPSIDILYGHLNKKLNRRMAEQAPFNLKDYMRSVNKIMTDANPETQDVGIINAQAIPQLLGIIMMSDRSIKDYLKTQNITVGDVSDLADEFADIKTGLDAVKEYISDEVITAASIKKAVRALNKSNYDIPLADPSEMLMFSANDKKQKPTSVASTTSQSALRVNPETATPEELNQIDPEKIVHGVVIKSIVNAARKKDRDDVTVKYQGIDVYFRPILSDSVYEDYFTSEDKKDHIKKGGKDSIAAFLTDSFGNMLFFDGQGNITTQDKGIPVYQYLRKVNKINNKLAVSNNTNWYISLIKPEQILEQRIKEGEINGVKYTETRKKELLKEITDQQVKEVNQLYNLRKTVIENPDKVFTLPIIGGSFGVVNAKFVPLTETDITEDEISGFTVINDANSGRNGYGTFELSRADDKLVSINNTVYTQRGNISEELAGKIADVLTTKAKINGREFSALERKNFAKGFLSNALTQNKIKIEIDESSGVEQLTVLINGKVVDLEYTKSSRDKIFNHLMTAIQWKGANAKNVYSANVNFDTDYLGKPFIDYTVQGDQVIPTVKNYFDVIKPFILIEYSKESLAAVTSLNGYLRYAMPEDLLPVAKQKEKTVRPDADVIIDNVGFEISPFDNAKNVTEVLVDTADAVISLSENFKSTTETLVRRLSGDIYSGLPFNKRLTIDKKAVKGLIVDKLNSTNANTVFFTGDDASQLKPSGITQSKLDKYALDLLTEVKESADLTNKNFSIVTNGQTGVSEAIVKAASKLNIPTRVITTSDWTFRESKAATKRSKVTFKDTKGKDKFLKRFGITVEKEEGVKVTPVKGTNRGVPKGKVDPTSNILLTPEDFEGVNNVSLLRSKSLKDNYQVTSAQEKAIIDWYKSTPISKSLPLTVITALVNSPAFAQFNKYGITLFKGDGGTALDIYHEAWHGFSQFFMTKDQKADLYNQVAEASDNPQWKVGTSLSKTEIYFQIEEALAEGFRDYKAGKYKPKTKAERNLFRRILDFLINMFKGTSARDTEFHAADLATVRELYDKLSLDGKSQESTAFFDTYSPSMNNIMFYKLNRSKTIQPVEEEDEMYTTFTIDESLLLKDTIDSMLASSFKAFSASNETSSGALDSLKDKNTRVKVYTGIQNAWLKRIEQLQERLDKVIEYNATAENPNLFVEQQITGQLDLLTRAVNEFGDIEEAINNSKYNKGVIAYHMMNSRFPVFKADEVELEEPSVAGSAVFKDNNGVNSVSPRDMLNKNTEMLLGSVFKTEVDAEGNRKMIPNELGYFQLENPEIVWSRLARTLEGSMTPADMYNQLITFSESYPEFNQILDLLPTTRVDISYADTLLETQFWQDLKKPRIQYTELNLNPVEAEEDNVSVKSSVINASTDTYAVMREWSNNFINETTTNNRFIYLETGRNMLDLTNVIKAYGISGVINKEKTLNFLATLGIQLDENSAEIKAILSQDYFLQTYGIDRMFNLIKKLESLQGSKDKAVLEAIKEFQADPIKIFREGFKNPIPGINSAEINSRFKLLATLQNQFSDSFSNFTAFTPEMNRVFEHFLDSTATRNILALNKATNWQQATGRTEADPNGDFKHMRWLAEENNPYSAVSVILNSMYNLKKDNPGEYGKKITIDSAQKKQNNIDLQVISGTKIFDQRENSEGVSTTSADTTTKYLQEMNTMLLKGVQEFMRHASKSLSLGLQVSEIITPYPRQNKNLYVDIQDFRPSTLGRGEQRAFEILLGYISAEHDRINRFNSNLAKYENWKGYNREITTKDGKTVMAAQVFTAFDDVLTEPTKNKLYAIEENLLTYLSKPENAKLKEEVFTDVKRYFNDQTEQNLKRLREARYVDSALYELATSPNMSEIDTDRVLSKAYTYNSWIHNFETTIIGYGDLVQYNHAKEEFHKRNAGWGGSGNGFRADKKFQNFVNSDKFRRYYIESNKNKGWKPRPYDGTLQTAIMQDDEIPSYYYDEYKEALKLDILDRIKDNKTITNKEAYAEEVASQEAGAYLDMNIGDGQGYISLESYRMLKYAEGSWSNEQENLYRKIASGQEIGIGEVMNFFPSYKLQYFGAIETEGLALNSFHKFSLTPLIPSVIKGTNLEKLHDNMMTQQMDYVTFDSGEKLGHITPNKKSDKFVNDDGTVNTKLTFTPNVIFAENLKNVTNVNDQYKGTSVFSTQLRKLILEGLYERGVIQTTDPSGITNKKVTDYIGRVEEYSELLKLQLLNEIGFEQVGDEYIPTDKASTEKIAELIRANLDRDDVVGDHLIEFIDVDESGNLKYDLSLHPEAGKIEKLILSVINKRLIKQKVHGEPLVQVSSSMYNGILDRTIPKFNKASATDIKKYVGSNFLPTYHKKADGSTAAMKVMIALQGDFLNLLKLKDKSGKVIGTLDRLNELVKDDEWLDYNNGANRKAITMAGVRIPVQGLNSMEFMEVYHFLPEEAGNLIIPPPEIVAKSGADFDIDKLTIFMPNLTGFGKVISREFQSNDELRQALAEAKNAGEDVSSFFDRQMKAVQNDLLQDIKNILELPENYASLIRPNSTYILQEIAEELSQDVMDYDPFRNINNIDENGKLSYTTDKKGKKLISPTRVLEVGYNLYKHESNIVGKRTLGLGAVENTFNVIFNALGAPMPKYYMHGKELNPREMRLFLRHNTLTNEDGDEVISLSDRYDVEKKYKIADLFSQAINGWVDVEKDAWIFFIQGNYEVAPILLYLLQAGVPVKEAIYFVSQPLVREYVKEQRLAKSTFAGILGKKPSQPEFFRAQASTNVINKYFDSNIKSNQRYQAGTNATTGLFLDREDKAFTEKEMRDLIRDSKLDSKEMSNDLSKTMFLHFLEIEQQIDGIKSLKFAFNQDTKLNTSIGAVEEGEYKLEALEKKSSLDQNLRKAMENESIISSFKVGPLTLAMTRPLYPLMFHKTISDYIIRKTPDIQSDNKRTFNDKDKFVQTFRNDIVLMILQNALRKYNLEDAYKSYSLNTTIPTSIVDKLNFGAYVKENTSGEPTLYVDANKIKQEYSKKLFVNTAKGEGSYTDLNLYPVEINTFTDESEYTKFVAEREYLRHLIPMSKADIAEDFEIMKSLYPTDSEAKNARRAYEKFLAERALENSFNPMQIFKNKKTAYALKLNEILKNNPNLANKYDVLKKFKVDFDSKKTRFHLFVNERKYTNSISNLYYKNFKDLANKNIIKVADPEENAKISEFFAKLPLYSFFQSGLNKNKLSFVNLVDYNPFIDVIQQETKEFMKILDNPEKGDEMLNAFYKVFIQQNGYENKDKYYFKNYFMNNDMNSLLKSGDTNVRFGVTESLTNPQIYTYSVLGKLAKTLQINTHYTNLANSNPDFVFIHNMLADETRNPNAVYSGQNALRQKANFSVGIATSDRRLNDNYSDVTPESYNAIKNSFEESIENIKAYLADNKVVAFASKGYGDPTIMPEELFVYLSKRLYEEFRYVNPGSTKYQEVMDVINRVQGISDAEILASFNDENNPFKCRI